MAVPHRLWKPVQSWALIIRCDTGQNGTWVGSGPLGLNLPETAICTTFPID